MEWSRKKGGIVSLATSCAGLGRMVMNRKLNGYCDIISTVHPTLEKPLNDLLNAIPAIGKWVNAHVGDRAAVSLANSITNKISIAKLGFLNVSSAMLNILQIANAAAYTGNISTLCHLDWENY